jgi:SAM-dependent methyltransferase
MNSKKKKGIDKGFSFKQEEDSTLKKIKAYERKIGVRRSKIVDPMDLWKSLEKDHKQKALNILNHLIEFEESTYRGNPIKNVALELKNEYLSLSLDFQAYYGNLHTEFLNKIEELELNNVKKVLEVGCDNGYVTNYLAIVFPNAEIVGIDKSQIAIDRAKELAQKLGNDNVQFFSYEINQLEKHFSEESFDLIISLNTLYYNFDLIESEETFDSIRSQLENFPAYNIPKEIEVVQKLLAKEDSIFICAERLSGLLTKYQFIRSCVDVGLTPNFLSFDFVEFKELINYEDNLTQQIPLFIFSKSKKQLENTEDINKQIINLLLSIDSFNNNKDFFEMLQKVPITSVMAEELFESFNNKELIKGMSLEFFSGGTEKIEIWKTNSLVFIYTFSNRGYRELKLLPLIDLNVAINKAIEVMEFKKYYGNLTEY